MTELLNRILSFFQQFRLLVIILPWERAARVRLGSRVALWEPGWHIKLPFIDEVVPMNTRLRVTDTGTQTLTTRDGHTLTVGISVGFKIADPLSVLLRMQQPESSCSAIGASAVARIVSAMKRDELSVAVIEDRVAATLAADTPYEFEFVRVRDFAYARTYRLLNENAWRDTRVSIDERKL